MNGCVLLVEDPAEYSTIMFRELRESLSSVRAKKFPSVIFLGLRNFFSGFTIGIFRSVMVYLCWFSTVLALYMSIIKFGLYTKAAVRTVLSGGASRD